MTAERHSRSALPASGMPGQSWQMPAAFPRVSPGRRRHDVDYGLAPRTKRTQDEPVEGDRMVASQSVGSGDGTVEVTTRRPGAPREAAFALEIDFQKGTDNPQRVFQAADAMVRAFQALDRALCAAVDSRIEPIMLLEDIEAGSIKAWLSSQLNRIDDEAIKDLDWRPLVGK